MLIYNCKKSMQKKLLIGQIKKETSKTFLVLYSHVKGITARTVCPESLEPRYEVNYYMKWVKPS